MEGRWTNWTLRCEDFVFSMNVDREMGFVPLVFLLNVESQIDACLAGRTNPEAGFGCMLKYFAESESEKSAA